MLIEGSREIARALQQGHQIETLYYRQTDLPSQSAQNRESTDLALLHEAAGRGIACIACAPAVFSKMALRATTETLLAVAIPKRTRLDDLVFPETPLVLLAEGIEKPGNLGAILRSADAAAVDALLLCDCPIDLFNPNVVRASLGALFSVPVVECTRSDALGCLRRNRLRLIAATPGAHRCYTEADLKTGIAFAVGAEDRGLTDFWLQAADAQVSIPMLGIIDSLNVAGAATILLYEALRQRTGPTRDRQ